jgi:acylphosphatase
VGDVSDSSQAQERREIYFSGCVQGVGFRYTARAIAARFDIQGFVENLSDGRVLLVVEGERGTLDHFVGALQAEMDRFIANEHATVLPASGEFTHFEVRR